MSKYRKSKDGDDGLVVLIQDDNVIEYKLPVWRKICFAIGGVPYQMTNAVVSFFFSIFLLEVAEIRPTYASIIVFGGRVWDAFTDPMCGFLVSRTNTRFGKFRPWILFSAPFACITYFLLWYVPDFSEEGKLGWYFVFYCLFQCLMSGLHVPYTSLTMVISNNQKDRDSATAYRMGAEAIGVLAASVIQGTFVNKYRIAGECDEDSKITAEELKNQKWSYNMGAVVMISVYMLSSIIVFLGTKERIGVISEGHGGFWKGLKLTLSFRPYKLLSFSFLFLSLGISIVQGNLALYCTHSLDLGEHFSTFITILLVSAILFIPIWQVALVRIGKKRSFAIGMIIFIPVLISQLYIPGNVYAYYPVLVLAGISVAVALLLPWSMLPDVLDEFMLQTGTRQDAIFYSFYVFFSKLAVGVGLGLSQLALGVGGYKTGECDQPASVGLALRYLVVPGPVVFTLIALLILWRYPIDENRRKQIKKELEQLKTDRKPKEVDQVEDPPPPDEMYQSSRSYQTIGDNLTADS